jgi:hypothetical protein
VDVVDTTKQGKRQRDIVEYNAGCLTVEGGGPIVSLEAFDGTVERRAGWVQDELALDWNGY